MVKFIRLLLLIYLCNIAYTFSFAQSSSARFVENKGQWDTFCNYRFQLWQGAMYIAKDEWVYELYEDAYMDRFRSHHHSHDDGDSHEDKDTYKAHTYRMKFINANPAAELSGEGKYPDYNNYYVGDDPTRWREKVEIFNAVKYKNLYPHIDARIYGQEKNVKYDFIIQPQGNPADIQVRYEYADKLELDKGNLLITTSVMTITELAPTAFQYINDKKVVIDCQFSLQKDIISYTFPKGYDTQYPLYIDPVVVFSTYTGSTQDNWGFTATYDNAGNSYGGGIIWSGFTGTGGYPLLGAYQTTYQGGSRDATITKFNPTGTALIFSTYLGGSQDDQPHSMVVDGNGNLFVFGRTNSTNFPTVVGAFDQSHNGNFDIFVAKFSPTGGFLASTFVGGNQDDAVNVNSGFTTQGIKYNYGDDARGDIVVDANNNIYVASCTKSTNFPTSVGSFDSSFGGQQDGVAFKMPNNLSSITWSGFLGGTSNDAAYSIQVDANNVAYVAGGTASNNIFTSSGVYQAAYQGGIADGFISKINAGGTAITQSTYVGTSSYDQIFFIELDVSNNIFVLGQTQGNFPKTPGTYGQANAKQFIAKLNNNLSGITISTTFGTNGSFPNISPTAFLVDNCNNIYVAGWGGTLNGNNNNNSGTSGLPTTPNAFSTTTDNQDFYIFVINNTMQNLVYATFFGGSAAGEHVDGGTSRFDKNGIIYEAVCAGCGGNSSFPSTTGVWSTTNQSSNCNLSLFKIDLQLSGMNAAFDPTDSSGIVIATSEGCAPFTVYFDNTTTGTNPATTTYFWDLGITGITSTQFEPIYTYQTPGTYNVMLIVTDSSSCNIHDTVYRNIIVWAPPIVSAGPDQSLCSGATQPVTLQASSAGTAPPYTYQWSPATFLSSPTVLTPTANPPFSSSYVLTVTDAHGCFDRDTVQVTISAQLQVNAPDITYCSGNVGQLNAFATGAITYSWVPTTGLSNPSIANPTTNNPSVTQYTVYATNAAGCTGSDITNVSISPTPVLTVGNDTSICFGNTAQLSSGSNILFSTYNWSPSTGVTNPNSANTSVTPTGTTTYTVQVTSPAGCTASNTIDITVNPQIVMNAGLSSAYCVGGQTTLNATAPIGMVYSWSPPTALSATNILNPIANPTQTTVYTLYVTDNIGCKAQDSLTVTVQAIPTINAGADTTICYGTTASLFAQSSQVSYAWSPATGLNATNIANPTTTLTTSTTYTVTATTSAGCQNNDIITVNVNPLVDVALGNDTLICNGGQIQLSANASIPNATYNWQPATYLNSNTIASPITTTPTSITYTLTISDNIGCQAQDSISIDVFNTSTINDTIICAGQSVVLTSSGGVSFAWNPPTYLSNPNIASPLCTPAQTMSYILTATSAEGCISTQSVIVQVQQLPTANAGNDARICQGESVQLNATGGVYYSWSPATALNSNVISNPLATPLDTIIYTLVVTDNIGCTDNDQITVFVSALPNVTAGTATTICKGDSTQIFATGAATYQWLPANYMIGANNATPTVFPNGTTTYLVTGTDGNGCKDTSQVTITVAPIPQTKVEGPTGICPGRSITLLAEGGITYSWNTGHTTPVVILSPQQSQWYVCTASSDECTGIPDSVYVNVWDEHPQAAFDATPDTAFAPKEITFINLTTDAKWYSWFWGTGAPPSNDFSPTQMFTRYGEFEVTLIAYSPHLCTDTARHKVYLQAVTIYTPSAFTPNGDTFNDEFMSKHFGIKDLHIRIYDRWGKLIYESFDKEYRWDGLYKNNPAPEGVYTWVVDAIGEDGRNYQEVGTVTLMR